MRLIDIEDVALLKTVTDGGLSAKALWRRINSQPTVDAVPVIRCKDCKYSSPNQVYGCRIHSFADDIDKRMYSDDYCSRAERKGNETD